MAQPKLDLIGIIVRDMAASLAFYRQLGLDIPAGAEAEGHVETVLPGGLRMAWDTQDVIRSFDEHWQPPACSHGIGMAFLCDSPAQVDEVFARLTGMGVRAHKAPWDAFWGQRYAQVLDPDGNVIDLFAPLG
ncbi:MAG: VOC family protein [Chloroflexi bacterium]|nr:VOC family protein [Chloroflexota bacterium]